MIEKKKKKVHIEQTKSIVTFTHFPTITIVVTVPSGTVATSKLKKKIKWLTKIAW